MRRDPASGLVAAPLTRRALTGGLCSAGFAMPALAARPAPITLLVGAPTGSGPDNWARAFAPFLERHYRRRSGVTVLNLPGDGGLVAVRRLAQAAPDGRTLGVVATPSLIARCIENGETSLLARLDMLAAIAEEPIILVGAPAALPGPELANLRALGERGLLGTPPTGSASQLAAAALGDTLPIRRLAFPSAAAARQAAIAGNLSAAMLPLPSVLHAVREGKLLGIALAQPQRSPHLPEVPSFAELGVTLVAASHRGIALPRGVPEQVCETLAAALRAAVEDAEYVAQARSDGTDPRHLPREHWASVLRRDEAELRERWERDPWALRGG